MTAPPSKPGPPIEMTAGHGLLPPELRRDLADLNGQYLELGLEAEHAVDARFAWSDAVRRRLLAVDRSIRATMSSVPFALFRLLPPTEGELRAGRIADLPWLAPTPDWQGRCLSFAHQAAFFARHLLDAAPLAANLVLDLTPGAQSRLVGMCPSELAAAAAHPGLIRPRWPGHRRFWAWLEAAARSESATALQWAHCMGVCLLGADSDSGPPGTATDPRRRSRR